jgi:hypothetical protein
MRRRRALAVIALVLLSAGGLAWRYQSELLGRSAGLYLRWVAERERAGGTMERRRQTVAGIHRLLLMPPPPDALVPELFEFATLLAQRTTTGAVQLSWAAYLYTDYVRDLERDRPDGRAVRSPEEVRAALDRQVEFFTIRHRPNEPGVRIADVLGAEGDSYTLEEIEAAHREGRELPLK